MGAALQPSAASYRWQQHQEDDCTTTSCSCSADGMRTPISKQSGMNGHVNAIPPSAAYATPSAHLLTAYARPSGRYAQWFNNNPSVSRMKSAVSPSSSAAAAAAAAATAVVQPIVRPVYECAVSMRFLNALLSEAEFDRSWSTIEVVLNWIIPRTAERQCRYAELISPTDLSTPLYFISHVSYQFRNEYVRGAVAQMCTACMRHKSYSAPTECC